MAVLILCKYNLLDLIYIVNLWYLITSFLSQAFGDITSLKYLEKVIQKLDLIIWWYLQINWLWVLGASSTRI